MKFFAVIVFLSCLFVFIEGLFVCPPNFCATVQCPEVRPCPKNTQLRLGGFCNCCRTCHRILGINETCSTQFIGGPPLEVVCGQGLVCVSGICQNIISPLLSLIV
ncbi:hypothetical protein Trydic_g18159 [Trypoxylus dichotomus]